MGVPGSSDSKASPYNSGDLGSVPALGRSPGGGHGNPLQYSCLENPHGQRSLECYSPWGSKELDRTERLRFHFSRSCIGEGNGNPLQCSCLENPRDWEAWWAAVYGVTQSWTRLKWLSRSSSSTIYSLWYRIRWSEMHQRPFWDSLCIPETKMGNSIVLYSIKWWSTYSGLGTEPGAGNV